MIKVIIKRSEWLRGEGVRKSFLYRESDEKMCCIGFLACVLKATKKQINKYRSLQSVKNENCIAFHNDYCDILGKAYNINDNIKLTNSEREEKLISLGKNMSVVFEFID